MSLQRSEQNGRKGLSSHCVASPQRGQGKVRGMLNSYEKYRIGLGK